MEIEKNNTWIKLCTLTWNEDEDILACMAMGYIKSNFYDNARYNDRNASNGTIRRNCSSLTNCVNTNKDEPQLCKGICHVKIVYCAMVLLQPLTFYVSVTAGMPVKQEDTQLVSTQPVHVLKISLTDLVNQQQRKTTIQFVLRNERESFQRMNQQRSISRKMVEVPDVYFYLFSLPVPLHLPHTTTNYKVGRCCTLSGRVRGRKRRISSTIYKL